jgi:hypothetical protein
MRIFKGVWSLPPVIENTPAQFLTRGEQRQQTIAWAARDKAWHIYNESPTQENIKGTAFGVWQAVVEYADYYASGGENNRTLATITGRNDAIKNKALAAVLSA